MAQKKIRFCGNHTLSMSYIHDWDSVASVAIVPENIPLTSPILALILRFFVNSKPA